MNEVSNTKNSVFQDVYRNASNSQPERYGSTQEQVDQQVGDCAASISNQPKDLTRLIQGMTEAHPNSNPMASTSARFATAGTYIGRANRFW